MKQLSSFSLVAIMCLVISCKEKPSTNIVCLVDFSQTIDSGTVSWYKKTIANNVLKQMGFKDRIIILPVDLGSQTASEELFKVDFSKNDYTNEFAGLQSDEVELKNHKDSVRASIHTFALSFEKTRKSRINFDKGTDIFGALKQAQKYKGTENHNIIVIFSDMLQYTDRNKMNFENHLNSLNEIDKNLTLADKADLSKTHIIVLTGMQSKIKPEKFNVIKSFWEKYFLTCNGQLIDYSSGAVSKLEGLLSQKD